MSLDEGWRRMGGGRGRTKINVVFGRAGRPARSFTWRIGSSSDSFYLFPLGFEVGKLRLSMHSPNREKGDGSVHFKLQVEDPEAFSAEVAAGLAALDGNWPLRFSGRNIGHHPEARHVMRLRTTWDVAHRLPPLPSFELARDGSYAFPLPEPGTAMDVDFYCSRGKPVFPGIALAPQVSKEPATLGPLRNSQGDCLTVIVGRHDLGRHPTPVLPQLANSSGEEQRALAAVVDTTGLAWIVETRLRPQTAP